MTVTVDDSLFKDLEKVIPAATYGYKNIIADVNISYEQVEKNLIGIEDNHIAFTSFMRLFRLAAKQMNTKRDSL